MQSKKYQMNKKFLKELKNLLKKYKYLKDIIIFGSYVKGKLRPNDVDIAIILINESELIDIKKDITNIAKQIKINKNIDIEIVDSIYDMLWPVLLREGFSIKKNKYLFELYNIKPCVLYKYNLTKLNPVQKVQFTRGLKTMIRSVSGKILSRTVVLIPINNKCDMDLLLDKWGIRYESREYELFPALRKESFL
ncbi:MAG: nucleotidyltransferase domain-containing protein [Candidatus Woesearchaeota archaeon]